MNNKKYITLSANEAVAEIAYKTNEACAIYPITPASEMSEIVEKRNALNEENIFGSTTSVFQMQSEAGVAGAMHGVLQTGLLSTTFTASQGLLLMLPNMYKIAGELTPNVIHVATRTIATHALSIFGDHGDVMAVRHSGYAFLGSASVQEAQDFALIAQASTLKSRIPFVHFFDGFRTSHESNKIQSIPDEVMREMIDMDLVQEHKNRALNPNNPVLRGSAQGPDTYFQSREAQNNHYLQCPSLVQETMDQFAKLTGRTYRIFEYVGHPQAKQVLISMASSVETIEESIRSLNSQGEKVGLIKVRLFRPFSKKHLLQALPKTVQSIAVLDRTKEPGSAGEPLYLDIVESLTKAFKNKEIDTLPTIVGGRYGLSSREFTPNMVNAILKNLKLDNPKNGFSIGIDDDITHLSLDHSKELTTQSAELNILVYENKTDASCQSIKNFTELIGENSEKFIQTYTEMDYKKSNARHVINIRVDNSPIKAPYLINKANLVICDDLEHLKNDTVLERLAFNGSLVINSKLKVNDLLKSLNPKVKQGLEQKRISFFSINLSKLKMEYEVRNLSISSLHSCILILENSLIHTYNLYNFNQFIDHQSLSTNLEYKKEKSEPHYSLTDKLLSKESYNIKVSELPIDGTFETGNSHKNTLKSSPLLPVWDMEACTQCGLCTLACPQAALEVKAYDDFHLRNSPDGFKSIKSIEANWEMDLLNYTIQVNPNQCNGCNNCVDACPAKALTLKPKNKHESLEANWNHFSTIPYLDRNKIDNTKISQQQLQEPLFKYSNGDEGCGEAPYLKLISQLFGDRMLIANATGASSIFGGALPTTPWSKNALGHGPAWSNSLFEDNAEFGLGFRKSLNHQELEAKNILLKLSNVIDEKLIDAILNSPQSTEKELSEQRERISLLKGILEYIELSEAKRLLPLADSLLKKSVWIVGGDGWAYDIGFGGIDHVLSSGENVNILVLDNEIYDNTGGQLSKATPFGAKVKFAHKGNRKQKKDLGLLSMIYDHVYVASVSIGANPEQTLKAFVEAESHDGPSIIMAYSHSKSHGINIKKPSQYHKAAVASGQWLLYRNDPRKSTPFQLDSEKPSIKIKHYLGMENRFKEFLDLKGIEDTNKVLQLQSLIDKRFAYYESLSKNSNQLV